jgi:DNA-binding NarL/FixJ family response regulator
MELLGGAFAAASPEFRTEAQKRWPELIHLIPDLTKAEPQKLTTENTQLRLFRATSGFIHDLAEPNPLVLLLDDLHWADSTSLSLFLYLARHLDVARVLILGTYRDAEVSRQHPLEATLRELIRERLIDEVHLRRLAEDGTAALVSSRLSTTAVSDDLVSLIHSRAQGNPFFIEELLASLVEQGALAIGVGRLMTSVSQLEVPRSVRSLIGERIGRLPHESQELLRMASLMGQEFDLGSLLATTGQLEDEVLDALDAALEARVIEELPGDRERFAFAHAMIQQALSEEWPVHRRRRMHVRIGEALVRSPSAQAASAELARHFLLGGDSGRAADYAIRAGDDAAARYAHAEAAHQYQTALDLMLDDAGDTVRAADAQYRLAGELYDLNRLPEALTTFEAALANYGRLGNRGGQALAHWGMARLHQGRYDMQTADLHIEEALRLWPPERQDADLVRLLVDAARIRAYGGYSGAIDVADRSLVLAEQLGEAAIVARALFGVETARASTRHHPGDLVVILDRAAQLAAQAGDWRTLSRVYLNRATRRWSLGDLEGTISDRRHAIAAAERSGEIERVIFSYMALGGVLIRTGAWSEARIALTRGMDLIREDLMHNAVERAYLAWLDGRHDDALQQLALNVDVSRQDRDGQGLTTNLCLQADFALQLGRVGAAESSAREAFGVSQRKWWAVVGPAAGPLAETLAWLGTDDASQKLVEIEGLVDACGLALARPQLLRAHARLLARGGALAEALKALEVSAELARSQHAVIELAQTLALIGSIARRADRESLATGADAERLAIVQRIGRATRGLVWAQGLPQPARVRAPDQGGGPLSPREREVATLIARGLSNRQIAQSLVISERTVENHVSSILARLGLDTRAQVSVWAVQHGLGATSQ